MIDTGAMITLLNKEIAVKLLSENEIGKFVISPPKNATLRSANGEEIFIDYQLTFSFILGDTEFTYTFLVVAGLASDIILGLDFIRAFFKCIDFEHNTLPLRNSMHTAIPIFQSYSDPFESNVHIVGNHTIPAKTARYIPILARRHITPHAFTATFTPNAQHASNITGAQLIQVKHRLSHILYENRTEDDVELQGTTQLGVIQELRQGKLHTLEYYLNHLAVSNSVFPILPVSGNISRACKRKNVDTQTFVHAHKKPCYDFSNVSTDQTQYCDTNSSEHLENLKAHFPLNFTLEDHLPLSDKVAIAEVILTYREGFVTDQFDSGLTTVLEHEIELTDTSPIYVRQFPLNRDAQQGLTEIVERLIKADKLEESTSPWNVPTFVVKKSDGRWRMVSDFRAINARTKRTDWPLPDIPHTLESLSGAKYFAQIDLSDAFFQIPLHNSHRDYTAFTLGKRHLRYKVMSQGLCGATTTFQRLITKILGDLDWCNPYIDDIIIPANTIQELLERCEIVFKRLISAGLKMGGKKTRIGLTEVHYLGYICNATGIHTDPAKIEAVRKWPKPNTVHQLRQFLGLCSYMRRFIMNFAKIAHPLTQQQSGPKDKCVQWGPTENESFTKLKSALCDHEQVLAYPDYSLPFIVQTDACKVSEGGILMQHQNGVDRVIAYASRCFSLSEQQWGITQQEAHAIFWSITNQFSYYLKSSSFPVIVRTDHKPCLAMQVKKVASERMYRWALALQEYTMHIEHISGKKHIMADAISRLGYLKDRHETLLSASHNHIRLSPTYTLHIEGDIQSFRKRTPNSFVHTILSEDTPLLHYSEYDLTPLFTQKPSVIHSLHINEQSHYVTTPVSVNALTHAGYQPQAIIEAQSTDESTKDLYNLLVHNQRPARNFNQVRQLSRDCFVSDNIVYRRGGLYRKQLLVPVCLQPDLLASMHDAPTAGHYGIHHTLHRIAKHYWWPGMSHQVRKYVLSCEKCQSRNIPPHLKSRTPAIEDEIPNIFERISIDVQGPFKKSRTGNEYIVTFLDIYSRWTEIFATSDATAETIASLLVNEIILRYGPIRTIITDQAKAFISDLIKEVCRLFRTEKIDIAAYHPEANAHVERSHRYINDAISKYVNDRQTDWDTYLPYINWAYRTSHHREINTTPYMLVFGRVPQDLADVTLLPSQNIANPNTQEWIQMLQDRLTKHRTMVEELSKQQKETYLADRANAKLRTFEVNDLVMIRNHVLVHGTADETNTLKWQPRFIGPYKVTARLGETKYALEHCTNRRDKKVYNINDLKPYRTPSHSVPSNVDLNDLTMIGDTHNWNELDDNEYELDFIVDKKIVQSWSHQKRKITLYRVRFKHYGPQDDIWYAQSLINAPHLIREYDTYAKDNNIQTELFVETKTKRIDLSPHQVIYSQ